MSDFIVIKMPYGKRHIYEQALRVTIEQRDDAEGVEVWGIEKMKHPDATFKTVRQARKHIRDWFNG